MITNINNIQNNAVDTHIVLCLENKNIVHDENAKKVYDYIVGKRNFTGKYKEVELLDFAGQQSPEKYIFVGVGDGKYSDKESIRKLFGVISKQVIKMKSKNVHLDLVGYFENIDNKEEIYSSIMAMVEGFKLNLYCFDKYLTNKKPSILESLNICVDNEMEETVKLAVSESELLVDSTCIARDLVNEPSNNQTPAQLAKQAKDICEEVGMECSIYDEKDLADLGMKALLAVGQASPNPPRLIVMRYKGNPDSNEIIGLVGKGITFDSGGLSLKNKSRLPHMKHDMAGAAAVIGAITAISRKKLNINVTAIIPATENLLSGKGYKPGDIIGSMGGKSILITSTDGEGRLILADGITYAKRKENISCAFDIATLTGGARQIFGGIINPVLSNNEELFNTLEKASDCTGERVHRLPIMPEARALLNTKIADIKNSSSTPYLRMQQGGMFVYEFVGDLPWIHIDISGAGLADFDTEYVPAGGTGRGVRNLYHAVRLISEK